MCEGFKKITDVVNYVYVVVVHVNGKSAGRCYMLNKYHDYKGLRTGDLSRVRRLVFNAFFGDGGCYKNGANYYLVYTSTSLDYLQMKRSWASALYPSNYKQTKSGYKGNKLILNFHTRNSPWITLFYKKGFKGLINEMDKKDLIMWYLDDGSFHQRKHFIHIYCNSLNDVEVDEVIDKIFCLYPEKKCVLRHDKKSDGRCYPYLYMPVCVANTFRKDVGKFLDKHNIESLRYKIGCVAYPQRPSKSSDS